MQLSVSTEGLTAIKKGDLFRFMPDEAQRKLKHVLSLLGSVQNGAGHGRAAPRGLPLQGLLWNIS